MKTKEEIITEIKENDCREYMSLPEMLCNLEKLNQFEVIDILRIVEKRLNQAYSAGFEACREKVEEEVKKFDWLEIWDRDEVLKTIKEVKE